MNRAVDVAPAPIPAVAQPCGAVERSGSVAAEPERDALLDGRGADEGVVELPEATVEGDALAGPEALHQHQPLLEAGRLARRRSAERLGEGRAGRVAHADPGDEPSVREAVEGREALGEVDGVAQDADEDGAAEERLVGERSGVGEQGDGGEVVPGVDGLLDDPAAVVAQLLDRREERRQHGDVDLAGEPLGYGDAETQVRIDDGDSPSSIRPVRSQCSHRPSSTLPVHPHPSPLPSRERGPSPSPRHARVFLRAACPYFPRMLRAAPARNHSSCSPLMVWVSSISSSPPSKWWMTARTGLPGAISSRPVMLMVSASKILS